MRHKINIQAAKVTSHAAALLIAIVGLTLFGQPQMKIADGRYCEGNEVLLPVIVDGFQQISSFTLYLGFDTQALTFVDIKNRNEQFNAGSLMSSFYMNNGDPLLIITWVESNNNPATVLPGKLFDLRFSYTNGESPVFFKPGCEISIGMSPVEAIFLGGSVGTVEITEQPKDQFVPQEQHATFNIQVNGSAQFQWVRAEGESWIYLADDERYLGATGQELLINNVPADFNNHHYRCEVTVGDCSFLSETATLKVSALSTGDLNANKGLLVYPNPFTNELNIWCLENGIHLSGWLLQNLKGEIISGHRAGSVTDKVSVAGLDDLSAGIYFLHFFSEGQPIGTAKVLKQ